MSPEYLAEQIRIGALDYNKVVNTFPELKEEIDEYIEQFDVIETIED